MTAPTLAIHVDVAQGLTAVEKLKAELRTLGNMGGESPLKSVQRQMRDDVASIKASLDLLNGHFGDTAKAIAAKNLFKEVTENAGKGGKDLDTKLGTVAQELKKRQKEFEKIIREGGTVTDAEMKKFMTGGSRIYPDQRLDLADAKKALAEAKAAHKAALGAELDLARDSHLIGDQANKAKVLAQKEAAAKALAEAKAAHKAALGAELDLARDSHLIGDQANKAKMAALKAQHAAELLEVKAHNVNMTRNAVFGASPATSRAKLVETAARDQAQGKLPSVLAGQYGSDVIAAIPQLEAFRLAAAPIPKVVKDIGDAKAAASPKIKAFTADLNDAHAGARGLASGFGALWLTYGRVVPLLAGAAVSAGFVQTIKVGAQVQHTFEIIRALSEESGQAVAGLNAQMLELARSGPFGPLEVANAMKTLSLAGLNAKEVSGSIRTVLQFAVAGDTTITKSAEVLSGVATAFGYTAAGYGKIADVIAKTAAISKSSVESMGEAFRASSVLGSQYGATLEDVALGLALLGNVNIQNGAAGTQLRNMYADLAGRTPKVRAALAELKFEFLDANGKAKGLVETFKFLSKALEEYDAKGQQGKSRDIFTERGGKPAQAGLQAVRRLSEEQIALMREVTKGSKEMAEAGKIEYGQYLDELSAKIKDAAGFATIAFAQMALTPLNQMKSVKAALEATFVETFDALTPQLLVVASRLKEVFASQEFKAGLERTTLALADATVFFVRFGDVLLALGAAFLGLKVVRGIDALLLGWGAAASASALGMGAAARAASLLTVEQRAAAAATSAAAAAEVAALSGRAKLLAHLGTALSFVSRLAPWVAVLYGAWQLYSYWTGKAADKQPDLTTNSKLYLEALNAEWKKLKEVNAAKALGLSLDDMKGIKAANDARGNLEKNLTLAEEAQKKVSENSKKKNYVTMAARTAISTPAPVTNEQVKANLAVEAAKGAIEDHDKGVRAATAGIREERTLENILAQKEADAAMLARKFGTKGPDEKAAKAAGTTKSVYDTLINSITDRLALTEEEIEVGDRLSESQRFYRKTLKDIADAEAAYAKDKKNQFTPEKAGDARAALYATVKKLEELEVQRQLNKVNFEAGEAQVKYLGSLDKTTEKLHEEIATERLRTAQLGLSKEARAALEAAEVEHAATTLESLAIDKLVQGQGAAVYEMLMAQAKATRDLAAAKREGGTRATEIEKAEEIAKAHKKAADDTAEAWKTATRKIGDDLSNVFTDWVFSGKSLMEEFRGWLVNTFNTLVLKPTFQMAGRELLGHMGFGDLTETSGLLGKLVKGAGSLFEGGGAEMFATTAAGNELGIAGASAASGATGIGAAMPYIGGAIAAYSLAKSMGVFGSDEEKEYAKGVRLSAGPGGVNGESYSKWSRAGGLFNPGSSGENRTALDADQTKALSDTFGGLRSNAIAFADVLGLGSDALKSFSKDIDLALGGDAAANQRTIEAAVAGLGNDLASQVLGSYKTVDRTEAYTESYGTGFDTGEGGGTYWTAQLERVVQDTVYVASEWARAGETANQTLTRLGGSLIGVNGAFSLLHHSLGLTGLAGADAASKLVDAFGGLESFATKTANYYDKYYSAEEKLANQRATVNAEMIRLTGGTVANRIELRKLVDQQDLSTDAGRNMYANLVNVSGAFDAMTSASEQAASAMTSLTDSLFDEVRRIRGLVAGTGQQGYAFAQAQFSIKTAQARAGDQDALKLLPSLSQNLLELASSNVSTLVELRRIQAGTAASLTATGQALGGIPSFDVGTDFVPRDMLAYVHKGERITPASQNNDNAMVAELRALRQEVASLRGDVRQTAENTKDTTDILQGATRGGLPLQTVAA